MGIVKNLLKLLVRCRKIDALLYYEEMLDSMPDMFITTDRRGIVTYVNKACCDLLGYKKEVMIGQSASMFFVPRSDDNGIHKQPLSGMDKEVYLGKILDELVLNGYVNGLEVAFVSRDVTTYYVVVEFKDTGIGIKPEIFPHLFQPFFTTKKNGTGLGLAVSYGIIKQHNGGLHVFSEGEGKGTEVKILLPVNPGIKGN